MKVKIKIAFTVPKKLQNELKNQIIQDGYDQKGKSRWVSEAISALLNIDSFPDLVKINDTMSGLDKLESILISSILKRQLDIAIINIRMKYPELNGVQSKIARTAIMQRIIRAC